MLLALEGVHLDRQFRRGDVTRQEHEAPAAQLRAVAEVEVFGQRVVLPAAAVVDGVTPPDAGGAVEVEEAAAAVAAAVLEHEVGVEQDGLDLREQRVVFVQVSPARLHHADLGVGEVVHRRHQEVGLRDEVGVEDRDVGAARHLHGGLERAGLVAGAVGAVDVLDVEAVGGMTAHGGRGDGAGLVGRVVEHLDLELLARVVDGADRVHEPVDHVHLVEDRQLDGDDRQLVEVPQGHRHLVLVLHVEVHHVVAVPPVHGQDHEHEEVGRENERLGEAS